MVRPRSWETALPFCSPASDVILLEFLLPSSQKLFRQSPVGISFVGTEKMSLAFVLEDRKNGDDLLPFMDVWKKAMQSSSTEIVMEVG